MKGKTVNPNLFTLVVIMAAVTYGLLIVSYTDTNEMTGLTEVKSIDTNSEELILNTGCFQLDMRVSESQLQSIEIGMSNQTTNRPLTHDLASSIAESSRSDIQRVEITNIENAAFISDLVLEQFWMEEKIDSRPSDAVAIAVRNDADIWVNERLLAQQGDFTCDGMI